RVLKSHIIMPFSDATMVNCRRSFAQRDFDLMLGDHRPRQRSPQQVLVFIDCAGLERGKNVARQKLFAQVFDNNFTGAGLVSLFDDSFNVVTLADIRDHGDDVVRIVFLKPWNDDRSIEASGICEYNFFRHGRSYAAGSSCLLPASLISLSARAYGSPPDRTR